MTPPPSDTVPTVPAVQARGLAHCVGKRTLFAGLDFTLLPGLHWVVGGEGSGKSLLLQVLAGRLAPTRGHIDGLPGDVALCDATRAEDDDTPVPHWLAAQRSRHPAWDAAQAEAALAAFGLEPHRGKQLHQLSTGSRRKLGLVAALACGAPLTLLDQPFSALDAASCRVLQDRLREQQLAARRIWVVADYERPAALPLGCLIALPDA